MTSSSVSGVSLMAEAVSYGVVGQETPVVIVNGAQGPDWAVFCLHRAIIIRSSRCMAHGDFGVIVLLRVHCRKPWIWCRKRDLAQIYRNPVLVICDGVIGQIMEAVDSEGHGKNLSNPVEWACGYKKERGRRNIIRSLIRPWQPSSVIIKVGSEVGKLSAKRRLLAKNI